ncbi:insulinase family protein [Idiomarina sp. HP20-50]|uniref:insulinase family protein n=1 Tax=Idiomarina sp. HP20-50 TaxID=3070813 RepID=UPI00294B5753|nr:insulinase family protein [Idiomarina sp. HP20-50]MDV6315524.1 insulinase family protein [Idiomarina sp. HP20-50]
MANSSLTDEVVRVVRSSGDKRDYQHLTLDNQLQVLLVHCPDSPKAAASVAVNAGHFDDPKHTQGLAHFLEHMLFLGSHSFPEPAAFGHFLNLHGGQHNAWTGTEFSNFHFDCNANALAHSLEFFSAMLKEPLLSNSWINKEIQSIESEFRLKENDELRRLYQVHKVTANPQHPFSQFSVGNLKTLKDDEYGSLKHKLQSFFHEHYVAQRMRLVISGPQSIQELSQLASKYFADIRQESRPKTPVTEPLYLQQQTGVWIKVKPIKVAYRLILTLPLPSIDDDYAHKTTSFIAHLLGYEGPGSLFSTLRAKGWVNSLSAGGGISGSNFKDFNINLQLTEAGRRKAELVVQWIFAYIRKIESEGIEDWRYNERRITTEMSFLYQEPTPVGELASQLSVNSFHYKPKDILYGDYRMDGLNHSYAQFLLGKMTARNARITLIAPDVNTTQVAPIYHTEYSLEAIDSSQHNLFESTPESFKCELPKPNRFLNAHFEPLPLESGGSLPTLIEDSEQLQLWHLQDRDFRVPKGHIYLSLKLPAVTSSALNFATARLWSELMIDALNDDLYDAEVAGLHFNIYPTQNGITIHTTGLSAGQIPLMQHLIRRALKTRFARRRWYDLKQSLLSNWHSAHQNQPLNKLFAELNQQLQSRLFRLNDLACELSPISFRQFTVQVAKLFSPIHITAFAHGDWQKEHALQLSKLIKTNLPSSQSAPTKVPPIKRVRSFVSQQLKVPSEHSDTAVLLYYQGGDDTATEQVSFMLLQQLIHQPVFQALRTEKQLGYVAGSQYFPVQRLPGILFFLQSHEANANRLYKETEEVIKQQLDMLDKLTLKEWHHAKSVLNQQIKTVDRNLRVRSQRLWGAIQLDDTGFNRQQQLLSALDHCQLAEWIERINQRLNDQSQLLKLQTEEMTK